MYNIVIPNALFFEQLFEKTKLGKLISKPPRVSSTDYRGYVFVPTAML